MRSNDKWRKIMPDILDYLAGKLARLLGTPSSSAKGLLRLAIHDRFPDRHEDISGLDVSEYKSIIATNVKDRLLRVHYRDVEMVINEMTRLLDDMTSVITMTRV
jgi:hypothetical protein